MSRPNAPSGRYIALPTSPPHGKAAWQKAYQDIQRCLLDSVQKVEHEYAKVPISAHDSVYIGVTGLAMMQYSLASRIPPLDHQSERENVLDPERLLYQADHNIYAVIRQNPIPVAVQDSAHASFLETSVGVATLLVARCVTGLNRPGSVRGDERLLERLKGHWDASVHLLGGTIQQILAEDEDDLATGCQDDGGSEVLYGRAGFLYALLYLRKVIDEAKERGYFGALSESRRKDIDEITRDASLRMVVTGIIRRGRAGATRHRNELAREFPHQNKDLPPLMWRWHGKSYLGGAHGVFGILQVLLGCPSTAIEDYVGDIACTLEWVLACQDEEGNWPTTATPHSSQEQSKGSRRAHDLIQWCHGAPGGVILLSTAISRSKSPNGRLHLSSGFESRAKTAIRRGADLVYERGLLRKGVGLCHGVGGSVYSLISASGTLDSIEDTPYLKKAVHLAQLATLAGQLTAAGEMATPDRPWSLYEGLSGMCCAWAGVLNRAAEIPERRAGRASGMPGYDDLL